MSWKSLCKIRIANAIRAGQEEWTHRFFSSGRSDTVTYYYAVSAQDWFGHEYSATVADQSAPATPVVNVTTQTAPIYYLDRAITVDGVLDEYVDGLLQLQADLFAELDLDRHRFGQ